jgi:hypothetical protein
MKESVCGAWTLRGMFTLRVQGVKLQSIYGRHCLASYENYRGKRIITRKWEWEIGLVMQAR